MLCPEIILTCRWLQGFERRKWDSLNTSLPHISLRNVLSLSLSRRLRRTVWYWRLLENARATWTMMCHWTKLLLMTKCSSVCPFFVHRHPFGPPKWLPLKCTGVATQSSTFTTKWTCGILVPLFLAADYQRTPSRRMSWRMKMNRAPIKVRLDEEVEIWRVATWTRKTVRVLDWIFKSLRRKWRWFAPLLDHG